MIDKQYSTNTVTKTLKKKPRDPSDEIQNNRTVDRLKSILVTTPLVTRNN